jgi:cyclase
MPSHLIHRRSILKGALGALTCLPLTRFASADVSGASVIRLNDKLAVLTGLGGNVVTLSTNDGLILVDGGAPQHSDALLATLRELPGGARVQTLFNTHWHSEQTGSNEVLGKSGAKIIAHEKTRLWLATDHWVPTEDRYEKARPKEAHPTETFYTRGEMNAGGERIEYGYLLEAHTASDIYVFFRDSNVLAVGDAASPERDPLLDWFAGGWLGGRIDALELLLKLSDDKTRIVPAFGNVITRADLQAEHDMLVAIFNRMVELVRKGYTTKDMFDARVMEGHSR